MTPDDLRDRHKGETALVLGNGPSRLNIDPIRIMEQGEAWVIGCNAIIRDVPEVDYIVAADAGPMREMIERGHSVVKEGQQPYPIYVSFRYQGPPNIGGSPVVYWRPPIRFPDCMMWSGPLAILLTMWMGCKDIYLAGFDFGASNIYRGQWLYSEGTAYRPVPPEFRELLPDYIRQLRTIIGGGQTFYQLPPHTLPFATPTEIPPQWSAR